MRRTTYENVQTADIIRRTLKEEYGIVDHCPVPEKDYWKGWYNTSSLVFPQLYDLETKDEMEKMEIVNYLRDKLTPVRDMAELYLEEHGTEYDNGAYDGAVDVLAALDRVEEIFTGKKH